MNPKSVAIEKFKVLWGDQRDRKLRHHSQLTSFYSIHIVRDFAEVYPAILRTDVHLIVICLTTPKKKTIQLCREIKLCSDHKHIPIILMDDGPIDEETECVALLNGADLVIASSVSSYYLKRNWIASFPIDAVSMIIICTLYKSMRNRYARRCS